MTSRAQYLVDNTGSPHPQNTECDVPFHVNISMPCVDISKHRHSCLLHPFDNSISLVDLPLLSPLNNPCSLEISHHQCNTQMVIKRRLSNHLDTALFCHALVGLVAGSHFNSLIPHHIHQQALCRHLWTAPKHHKPPDPGL